MASAGVRAYDGTIHVPLPAYTAMTLHFAHRDRCRATLVAAGALIPRAGLWMVMRGIVHPHS